jgi:glycerophosphoryl diester phosphodiesterase
VIISFSADLLKQAKKLLPDIECRLLVGCDSKMTPDEKRAFLTKLAGEMVANGFDSVGPAWTDIDKATVDMFHKAGLTVHPWTVDDPATAQKLIDMGVDSITSNCPKRLADSLAKK